MNKSAIKNFAIWAEFEKQIKGITALEDGSLVYEFKEGGTKRWQRT